MTLGRLSVLCMVAGTLAMAGCSSMGVKPWQRDVLAREEMQLDADPLDAAIDDHMYFSKEASFRRPILCGWWLRMQLSRSRRRPRCRMRGGA